jgi:hypothetical protein
MYFLVTRLEGEAQSSDININPQDIGCNPLLHSGRGNLAAEAITVDKPQL